MNKRQIECFALGLHDGMRSETHACGGGAEVARVDIYRRNTVWWLYQEPAFTTYCSVRVASYAGRDSLPRITAVPHVYAPGNRIGQLFKTNGLSARGIGELTFAKAELQTEEVVKELGRYFVRAMRGVPSPMACFEGERDFPGYAWTTAAWQEGIRLGLVRE